GVETRIEAKRRAGNDRNQVFAGLQLLKFGVVLYARQIHPVNFLILQEQGFVRRTKYGIPTKTPQMRAPDAASAALGRDVTVKTKRRSTDCEGHCKNNYGALDSPVQRSGDQRSGLNLSFLLGLYDPCL